MRNILNLALIVQIMVDMCFAKYDDKHEDRK